jgi:TPR repeat protein
VRRTRSPLTAPCAQRSSHWCMQCCTYNARTCCRAHQHTIAPRALLCSPTHTSSRYNLAWCYENGRGIEKDEATAAKLYRKAAVQGHARAQHNLGWCLMRGRGVECDEEEAVVWFRRSADQELARGQLTLGWCYDNGKGGLCHTLVTHDNC